MSSLMTVQKCKTIFLKKKNTENNSLYNNLDTNRLLR